jgi:hypothetical protein
MKKIVCLIDFERAYDNLTRYAARLAHDTSSKLIISTLQPHTQAEKVMVTVGADEEEYSYGSSRLSEICDQLRGIWKIPCEYHEFTGGEEEVLSFLNVDIELIVAGIESAHNTSPSKILAGANFRLIREATVPVLLVPDHFQYNRLGRLLYAFDYVHDIHPPVERLQHLAEWLHADVRVLSVVKEKYSVEEEEKIDRKNGEILASWKSKLDLSFDYIYYADVTRCLDHYLDTWRADDMIIFSIEKPSLVQMLFHSSIIRQMMICSDYPILIIHKHDS